MTESNIGEMIEHYAMGTASEREIERLEALAAADPSVAQLMRAEVGIRQTADVRQASLETARPEPSPLLMDMLRRTPPVPAPPVPSAPAPHLFGGRGIMLLLGTLLVGIVVGTIWIAPALDADSVVRTGSQPGGGEAVRTDTGSAATRTPGAVVRTTRDFRPGTQAADGRRGTRGSDASAATSSEAMVRVSPPAERAGTQPSRASIPAQTIVPDATRDRADEPISAPRGEPRIYGSDSMKVRIEMRSSGGK